MRRIGIVNDDIEHLFSSETNDKSSGSNADQTQEIYRRSQSVLQTWKSNRDPTPCNIVLASSADRRRTRVKREGKERKGSRPRTRLCASSVRQQHPRHDLLGHPLPQLAQHRLVPLSRARLHNVFLDVLVAHARDERLVAVREPKQFKGRPEPRILHRRGDVRRYALRRERQRCGEEPLEPRCERRGQDRENVRLKGDDVGGRYRVS